MSHGVGVTVHHQKRILAPRDHQMRGVVTGARGFGKKIGIGILLFEILHPPRTPESLNFSFRKIAHAEETVVSNACEVEQLFTFAKEDTAAARGSPRSMLQVSPI